MRDFTKISHFLFFTIHYKKVGQIISRILCFPFWGKCLSFIWMGCCQTILTAYPPTLSEPLLVVGLLGVAPYRVYLISLQPNCTCFLLHWSSPYDGRALPAIALCGVRTFLYPKGSDKLIYPTFIMINASND